MAGTLNLRGAARADLPFEVGLTRPSTQSTQLDPLLGEVWPLPNGAALMLVQHVSSAQSTATSRCLEWTDTDAFTVQATSATGDQACGVTTPNQVDLASDDYFFMLVPGNGTLRVSCTDSGAGITAGDVVQPTADGDVITDAAREEGVSLGVALNTAVADAAVDVLCFATGLEGGQA